MRLFARARAVPESSDAWRSALQAALRVTDIGSSKATLPDAMQAMVGIAVDLVGAQRGSIMLVEDDGRTLVLTAASGLPDDRVGDRFPATEGVAGRVVSSGRPMLLREADDDPFTRSMRPTRQTTSSIVVPLQVQDSVVGVLSLARPERSGSFTKKDLRITQVLADQAAGLVNRAKFHDHAEQRSSDLLTLVESSKLLLGTLDVDALLQRVLDGAGRLAASAEGFACLLDPDSGAIARGVFRGLDKATIRELVADPEVEATTESGGVNVLEREGVGTFITIGLSTTQGTRGIVVVPADRDVVDDRAELFSAFAQQSATALGAAELHSVVQRKESELSSIIHGVPNAIVLVDARGRIVALNVAAEELFRISAVFAEGAPVRGALDNEHVEDLLTGEGQLQSEVLIGNPPRTYKARVTDVHLPERPIGRVLIMDDVTSERQLVETQRDFVSMIGHELRTPLTIIKGFTQTLIKRGAGASVHETQDALETIDAKAAQLERLIEDLLYVSRIETREASLRIDDVDIEMLVRSVADDVVRDHPDRKIVVEVAPSLMWPCDETKVRLVLRHLMENGLKYSEAPHPVIVRATMGTELRVDVEDRGVGVLSSDIPQIFERFRQVDSSSTRAHGGTGVGLYLCAQLVHMHGGRIWVDSAWGKGSTFSFSLPRRAAPKKGVQMHAERGRRRA